MATLKGGSGLQRRLHQIADKAGRETTVSVGFLSGATYPDGTSVPLVATINEFGDPSRNQPPRPFFRRMIAEKKASWPDALAAQLKSTDYNAAQTMDRVGQGIKGQLQQSIRDLTDPPLAASTVRAKGFDKALIDTGHMLNSVDYEVDSE